MARQSGYATGDGTAVRKTAYKLTRYEMETTVNFNAEEGTAILYTRDKAVMRRLDKLVTEFPTVYQCTRESEIDKTYVFPKKYALPKKPRVLSEEQREKMRDRLAKAREKQQDATDEEDFYEDDFDDDFTEDDIGEDDSEDDDYEEDDDEGGECD